MSFNFIIDPATLVSYSIFSKEGVALLKIYVNNHQTGGSEEEEESDAKHEPQLDLSVGSSESDAEPDAKPDADAADAADAE